MRYVRILTVLVLIPFTVLSQQEKPKWNSFFSFNVSLSDYSFPSLVKESSLNDAFQTGDWYKPGKKSFGVGFSYWKGFGKILDFSTTLTGTFSNFPANFVLDDTKGQAKFTTQLDALLHLKMFSDRVSVNPFFTAGIGAGYFPGKFAAYAPLGLGFQFKLSQLSFMNLQLQWRKKFTEGITNDYIFYSLSIAQSLFKNRSQKRIEANKQQIFLKPLISDSDSDNVPDSIDKCPTVKGTVNGCPDNDGDGVPDISDPCPQQSGTVNGCPDSDNDGIADKDDKCKAIPGIAKYSGCPVPDTDKDGVNDEADKCPTIKGTITNNGCPDISFDIKEKVNFASQHILFAIASDVIQPVSYSSLDEVVKILKQNQSMKLSIAAHADNNGTFERNMMWSQRRAKAVADYFIKKGISSTRVAYKGYGDTQPVADNGNEEGRAKNRRVELKVSY